MSTNNKKLDQTSFSDHLRINFDDLPTYAKNALKIHWTVFFAVNGFLLILNIAVGYHYPWHLFPLFSWGIGIVIHTAVTFLIHKYRYGFERGFYIHQAVIFTLIGFLLAINILTGFGYPWFLWPSAALLLGLSEHYVAFVYIRNQHLKVPNDIFHVLWYPGVVCIFLTFVDIMSDGNFNWFWWPTAVIMLTTYVIVANLPETQRARQNQLKIQKPPMNNSTLESVQQFQPSTYAHPASEMNTMKYCPKCGEKNTLENQFCEYCGQHF